MRRTSNRGLQFELRRAAAKWRTSRLSREVLVMPAMMALVLAYRLAHYLGFNTPLVTVAETLRVDPTLHIGLLGTLAAFALFVCTAMIYASVPFLQEWHSPLTVANFTLFGIASGFMLAAAYSAWLGSELVTFFGTWAVIAAGLTVMSPAAALLRNGRIKRKSSLQTAIGVRHTSMTQKAQGATGGSFNTREFFHGKSTRTLRWARRLFLVLVFPAPVALIALGYGSESPILPFAAFVVQYIGLVAERWYFFAEAEDPQNLYYQGVS